MVWVANLKFLEFGWPYLVGGSWVVISRVITPLNMGYDYIYPSLVLAHQTGSTVDDTILHYLKDPEPWELWYSPYYGIAGF